MRVLLAVDPGSSVAAAAHFLDGELYGAPRCVHPPARMTWLERMELIAERFVDRYSHELYGAEVVAIEETVPARFKMSPAFLLARGYLIRVLSHELYPRAQLLEVPLPTVRVALGLRANAKREDRQRAARERFPGLHCQDAADACAIGLGAMRIAEERAAQPA